MNQSEFTSRTCPPVGGFSRLIYLVQSGLRHRVVFYVQLVFVGQDHLKDPCQGGGGDLVLQSVVVFLSLDAAGECVLHERLGGVQVWGAARLCCPDLHGHHVAVTKSTRTQNISNRFLCSLQHVNISFI